MAIKVCKIYKFLEIFQITGRGLFQDNLNFFRIYFEFGCGDDEIEVIGFHYMEFVFQDIYWESSFFQDCQDFIDIFDIFFFVFEINEDIIQIYCDEIVEEFVEDVINEVLEDVKNIVEIEWHHQDFVESESDDEAIFYSYSSIIWTLLKTMMISSLMKILILYKVSRISQIRDKGYQFLMMTLFRPR